MQLAIYDMDRTITRRGTFTPFLIFAAKRRAPWRLVALPVWVMAMACHKAKLVARKPLKQFGIGLLVGRDIPAATMRDLADLYTAYTLANNIQPGALAQIAADRAAGWTLVMATAAPEFYATSIGKALGFNAVIATHHLRTTSNGVSNRIDGENCYGSAKLAMIRAWLTENGHHPQSTRFYSDDLSDAPTLEWADEGIVVNADETLARVAQRRGWQMMDFTASPRHGSP